MDQVLQWNARSINNKKHNIIYLINNFNPICFAITETWLKPSSSLHFPGFACLRHDRQDGWDGAALLINNKFKYSRISLPVLSGVYAVAAKLPNFSVLNVYVPHPSPQIIADIKLLIRCLTHPLLLVGDFNSHHTLWGSVSCDSSGHALADLVDDENLLLLNDGRPTRRSSPLQAPSAVDLSFCSFSLAPLLSWNLHNLSYGSDHFPISISFPSLACRAPFLPLQKFRLEKADWEKFSQLVSDQTDSLPVISKDNLEQCYEAFVVLLHSAADKSIPLKKKSNNLPPCPWWDNECSSIVKDRNRAECTFARSMTLENFINFKKAEAKCKRTLSNKKRLGWRLFCESLSPSTHSSIMWTNLRKFRSSKNSLPSPPTNITSWYPKFLDKLAPPFVPLFTDLPIKYCILNSTNPLAVSFSFAELKIILDSLTDSAPGIDGIPYSFLVKAKDNTLAYFLSMINCMFSYGFVPVSWKDQIVLPILKPGKDPECWSSYRPIALSSVLGKITEHLVKNRLDWFVESNLLLPPSQFGFRKGKSITDSHSILCTDIQLAFSKNHSVVATFLDIAGAYDNVLLSVLRIMLLQLSVPWIMVQFICNFLTDRKISLRLDGQIKDTRRVFKGLPQGSVWSPILFNIYTHDLWKVLNEKCKILQYADDICIYSISKNVDDAVSAINSCLEGLCSWLDQHGLEISPSKSCAMVFCRKRSMPQVVIKYRDEKIPIVESTKFLGLNLDYNLSGKSHIDHIVRKCEKNINVMKALSGVWWGGHPYTQKLVYNALIRSILDFGSFLLPPCGKTLLHRLDDIQVKALRVVLGAMKSSPRQAVLVESSDPPLYLRRQYLADRFLFRIAQTKSHPLLPRLQALSDLLDSPFWRRKDKPPLVKSFFRLKEFDAPLFQLDYLPLYSISFDSICFSPTVFLNIGLDKNTPYANTKFCKIVAERWPDWDLFFSDASKSNGDFVGAAFIHLDSNCVMQHKLPVEASVFTGECVAILSCLSFIIEHNITHSVIFSDCLSALQAVSSNPFRNCVRNFIVCKIKKLLFSCHCSNLRVVLAWVPGHIGIVGNERADVLAKSALSVGNLMYYINYSQDILCVPSNLLQSDWNRHWEVFKYKYSLIQPRVVPRPWFFKFRSFSKSVTSVLIRLRLGHVCSPVQLFKFKIYNSPICPCGVDVGSLNHIFFSCPLRNQSSLYFTISKCNIPLPLDISCLLSFPNKKVVFSLANFIQSNNIRL